MNFINSGNLYGTVFINLIGGFLAKYYGWEMIFYIPGKQISFDQFDILTS